MTEFVDSDWRNELRVGDKINALDIDNVWYEALIVGDDFKKSIKIRFMGWSEKWDCWYTRDSERISEKYSKVPNWRPFLKCGMNIEISNNHERWALGTIKKIDKFKDIIEIIIPPNGEEIEMDINSPLIAEQYTHCGYKKIFVTNEVRQKMLEKSRIMFENIKKKELESNKSLSVFLNNNIISDIKLKLSDDSIINAHKIILISKSKYFNNMFLSQLKESKKEIIEIKDYSYEIFLKILKYIYSDNIEFNNENYMDILDASNFYQIDSLKNKIQDYIIMYISIINVFDLLEISYIYNLEKVKYKCLKYIFLNYFSIKKKKKQNHKLN
jgi:hypothetical protein